MHIALVHLGAHYGRAAASPPLGLLSLAAWAREKRPGLTFTVIDQYLERIDYGEVERQILATQPDVVAFSYMTRASSFVPGITERLKAALPGCTILLGGPHPSAAEESELSGSHADALVSGEGEIAFEMILDGLASGSRDFTHVPGLICRTEDGEVVRNAGSLPGVEDLDTLPFIAYDLIEVERYWQVQSQSVIIGPRRYMTLFSSRGCPYRCIYCHDVFGKTFRAQSAERVVAEIEYLQQRYGIQEFDFMDDIFNLHKPRVFRFAELVNAKNLKLKLTMGNGVRTDILNEEVVDAMVDAGVFVCGFALESGSKRLQKLMKKNLNIDKFLKGVEMMARKRVYSYGLTMMGFPTETAEEVQMTIDTAVNSKLHQLIISQVTPYPKTALYDVALEMFPQEMRDLRYANHDYQFEPVINLSTLSDEGLAHMMRKAIRSFYIHPERLFRIARDFPTPSVLPRYFPGAVRMAFSRSKGYFQTRKRTAGMPPGSLADGPANSG